MSEDEGGFRTKLKVLREMRNYTVIWSGQVASLIGSGMTFFALMVLIFEETGEVTSVSLLFFAAFGPSIILAPIAGVIIDRYNRKWIMAIADVIAALSTVGIMVLYMTDNLVLGQDAAVNSGGSSSNMIVYSKGSELILGQHTEFHGAFWGPNTAIIVEQNTNIYGSFVGKRIKIANSACIHYDRSLSKYQRDSIGKPGIVAWREL